MSEAPFATFDLETAKVLPARADPNAHLPLGITVAAARLPSGVIRYWHGGGPEKPSPALTGPESAQLVHELAQLARSGTDIVTWNGARFDFVVLAHESGMWKECARLAQNHMDIMFHFFCEKGYPVSLQAVGQPLGLEKAGGMHGDEAPAAWRDGQHERVKEYLAGDVSMLAGVYLALRRDKGLHWITRRGRKNRWPVRRPLTVKEAASLPEPDTSWMDAPLSRDEMCGWITERLQEPHRCGNYP